jgi:DNA polymerase elongation subunit (family B)
MKAADAGDEIRKLFYKLVMNSSYGKFAQDPRKYENWLFDPEKIPTPFYCAKCHDRIKNGESAAHCDACATGEFSPYGWYLHTARNERNIYASPQRIRAGNFFNVATAASITSAARASLLYGIQAATRPLYCDTDSVICESMGTSHGVRLHASDLGAWKPEAVGDTVAIAGKKLYAVYFNGECVKKASKGVRLTADQIRRVCDGETIEYANPVPRFGLNGEAKFVTRKIRRTGI